MSPSSLVPVPPLLARILYWLAVLAIAVALTVALLLFFESRDDSSLASLVRAV